MMTILRNRASISQSLDAEMQNQQGPRKHIPIATVREILKAKERGWDSPRISKEYNVDPSVVEKLKDTIAIPVDNEDGIV